jgi:hypothetical protein
MLSVYSAGIAVSGEHLNWTNQEVLSNGSIFLYIPSPQSLVKGFSHVITFLKWIGILLTKNGKNVHERHVLCQANVHVL